MSSTQNLAVHGGDPVRKKPFPPRRLLGEEEKAAVDALFDESITSGEAFGYNGPTEEAYCREFADFMGCGFADAVNSGTSAVYVALRALDIQPLTEVIVPAITDPGGIMPVPLMNCIPVIADTAPGSYNTGPEEVEAAITSLTSAIVVAHIGGEPCDIEGIMQVAKEHNLPVVEDCSQSPGAKVSGRLVGSFGDVTAFSTMFGKHFCTGGQGGMVFTRNESLYKRARQASDRGKPFGLAPGSTNCLASLNFNLGDLPAAIGRVQLKKLPEIIRRRREIASRLTDGLSGVRSVVIPKLPAHFEHCYWFWRLVLDTSALTFSKNTFCDALAAEGIPVSAEYAAMPHTNEWYAKKAVFGNSSYPWSAADYGGDPRREFPCPNAVAVTKSCFNLYFHENWGEEEIADTVAAFGKVERAYRG